LDDISWASQKFFKYWTFEIGDKVWLWNPDDSLQSLSSIKAVHNDLTVTLNNDDVIDSCMLFPDISKEDIEQVENTLFRKLYAVTNSVFHVVPLSPSLNTFIFKTENLILTAKQLKWKEDYGLDISDLFLKLKSLSLPTKTKYIFKDIIHMRLRTLYRKDICSSCGEIIHGEHFLSTCSLTLSLWDKKYNPGLTMHLIPTLNDKMLRYLVICSVTSWLKHIFTKWERDFDVDDYIQFNISYNYKAKLFLAFDEPYDFKNVFV
jgi:hypothetical protein